MARKPQLYWRNKADKEVSKYYRGLPCKVCGSTYMTCGHHIVHRSVAYYRHHPSNLIPLCPKHHKFSNELAAHSSNPLAVQAFLDWLKEHYVVGYECLLDYKKHLGEKVDYEQQYLEWREINENADSV